MAEYKNIIKNEVVITGEAEISRLEKELTATKSQLDRVNSTLQTTESELGRVQSQFNAFAHGNGIDILQAELERFRDTAKQSIEEFKAFLATANLNDAWGSNDDQFEDLFNEIKNGSMTAAEAITHVKTEFRALMEDSYNKSGGLFDSQVVQQFTASLENLGQTVSVVLRKIETIESEGVKAVGGSTGGSDIAGVLEKIESAARGMTAEVKDSYASITELVKAMNDYASVDSTKLLGVSQAFRNIADIGKGNYGAKSISNIIHLASELQKLSGDVGSIRFDFTGFNDLKVSKASLNNLATYLPQIAAINASKLSALSKIDLTNFNNIKISKSSVESIAQLAEAMQVLKETKDRSTKVNHSSSGGNHKEKNNYEAQQYQDASKAIKEYYASLILLAKTKGNDVSLTADGWKSAGGNYDALADSLNRTKIAFDLVTNAMNEMPADRQAQLQTLMAQQANQYSIAIERQANTERLAAQAASERAEKQADAAEQARLAKEEAARIRAISSEAARQEAQQYQDASKAIKEYYASLILLAKTKGNDVSFIDNEWQSEGGNYSALAASINKAEQAYSRVVDSLDMMSSEHQTQLNALDTQQLDRYNLILEQLANNERLAAQATSDRAKEQEAAAEQTRIAGEEAKKEAEAEKESVRASEAATKAKNFAEKTFKSYHSAIIQGESSLRKWAGAEKSQVESSKNAYKTLRSSVDAMRAAKIQCDGSEEAVKRLSKSIEIYQRTLKNTEQTLRQNGDAHKTFSQRLGGLAEKFGSWLTVSQVIMHSVQAVRMMIKTSIELDNAMTQLRIVTHETDRVYDEFGSTISRTAKKIGASVIDLVDSTTTYARLGYSLGESSQLAEFTAMLQNVGDIDAADAQDAITSIIKAFDINVNQIESVMDKLVAVGNNYPISVSQIAEGMTNASSALHAAGNTFEESVALLTAANTTIQNAAKSSTGLRTIAARVRNTKAELDELGETMTEAAYDELVKTLTDYNVALVDTNGEYRSTYDIMSDIAAQWDSMTSMEQSALATAMAGTRQQAVFFSIIEQFREASGSMDTMANSANMLQSSYNEFMKSTTAHINSFKASFSDLSTNIMDNNLLIFLIDIGTGVLDLITLLERLHLLLPAIAGAILLFKGIGITRELEKSAAMIATISATIVEQKRVTDALKESVDALSREERERLAVEIQNAVVSSQLSKEEAEQIMTALGLTSANGALTASNHALGVSFKSLMASIPVWGWIALGVSVVVDAVVSLSGAVDGSKDKISDLTSEFSQLQTDIRTASDNFSRLKNSADETIPRFTELASGVNEFGENVSLTEDEYTEFLQLNNKIAEMFPELTIGMDSAGNSMLSLSYSSDTLSESLYNLVEAQREVANNTIADTMPDVIKNIDETETEYEKEIDRLKDIKDEWNKVYNGIIDKSLSENAIGQIDKAKELGLSGNLVAKTHSISVNWDYEDVDNADVEKLYNAKIAEIDKLIHDYENRIASKWKQINPVVNAWMQTDFMFNDMNERMQLIAESMVSGLDFGELGLTTQEGVQEYISKNILEPLFLAGDDVKEAFSEITDWQDQLKNGEITVEKFGENVTACFNNLLSSMNPETAAKFTSIFISGFNAMGIEGETFDDVILSLINNWATYAETAQSASSQIQATVKSTIASINSAVSHGTEPISFDDYNSEELKDYQSAIELVNGSMQINAEKAYEIAEAKAAENKALIKSNKAMEQSKYLENAKAIEKLRAQLQSGEYDINQTEESTRAQIKTLLEENSAIAQVCKGYDFLSIELERAVGAYQHWINAQSASDYGDIADDAVSAIQLIADTYNSESDIFGDFGSKLFVAAVDWIIPDDIDQDDMAAIESYMGNIKSYLKFDEDGKVDGLNIDEFLSQSVSAGLMNLTDDGEYKIAGQKTMDDFAEGLGLSVGVVQAMIDELQLKRAKFDWADEANQTFGDLAVSANEAAEKLKVARGEYSDPLDIKLDVSDLETKEEKVDALNATIKQMDGIKAEVNVDSSDVEYANEIIRYCVAQKQLLSQPDVMMVDTSVVEGSLGDAISLLQEFKTAQDDLEMMQALGLDTTQAQSNLDATTKKIQDLDTNLTGEKALNIDTTSVDSISESLQNLTADIIVKAGVDDSAIIGYQETEHNADGTVTWNNDTTLVDAYAAGKHYAEGTVAWYNDTDLVKTNFYAKGHITWDESGKHSLNGTANAGGTWGTKSGGMTLVGELGREIVVDPYTGKWYTVGDNGAEFRNIPRGSIVFNHKQSEALLENGYVAGRARALVGGSALFTGGYLPYTPSGDTWMSNGHGGSSSHSGSGNHSSNSGHSSSNSTTHNSDTTESDEDNSEIIDWIEIAIDRIERAVNHLSAIASSSFKSLMTKLKANNGELEGLYQKRDVYNSGYQRYMQEAESVGLSDDLASKVKDGTIDITEYEGETAELIKQYQEWYEKALDCSDAMQELSESIASVYENKFNDIASDYENQLSLLEHLTATYDSGIKELEERGYIASTEYYAALQDVEHQKIASQKKELADLTAAMSEAMGSGEIEEGSDAWYSFQQNINDVKEEIREAELNLIEFGNAMRDIEWQRFDYLQERISAITDESDFLLDLLDNSDLYTDNGQLTEAGTASIGLHGQNLNVYMAQADKYADEILSLNKEIADDPNNTKLIQRKEELLQAQRDSILAAEDEKQAIVDMVEEGIRLELDALQELISSYNDALDSAKNMYEYQKKVHDQTSEIAKLQKQLTAYSGDDSEENRAIIQKIEVSLAEAKDNLEETQYEHYVSEQKKLLDELYDEYEIVLNQRLDNVDALLLDMIEYTNANATAISDKIGLECSNVGYTLTDSMKAIWSNEGGAGSIITKYGESFGTQLTSVNNVLASISANVAAMVEDSDSVAETVVEQSSSTTQTDPSLVPSKPDDSQGSTSGAEDSSSRALTDKDYYGVALAIWRGDYGWGDGSTRQSRLKAKGFDADRVQSIINQLGRDGYIHNGSWSGRYYGITDLSPYHFNKYSHGGLVDYTGLAQVDGTPSEPEVVLDAEDSENFISLRDAVRKLDSDKGIMKSILGGGISADIISHLARIDTPATHPSSVIRDVCYEINIPIDHVQDYEDFMNQMRKDGKFEQYIQSITVDRLTGGSRLSKNRFQW